MKEDQDFIYGTEHNEQDFIYGTEYNEQEIEEMKNRKRKRKEEEEFFEHPFTTEQHLIELQIGISKQKVLENYVRDESLLYLITLIYFVQRRQGKNIDLGSIVPPLFKKFFIPLLLLYTSTLSYASVPSDTFSLSLVKLYKSGQIASVHDLNPPTIFKYDLQDDGIYYHPEPQFTLYLPRSVKQVKGNERILDGRIIVKSKLYPINKQEDYLEYQIRYKNGFIVLEIVEHKFSKTLLFIQDYQEYEQLKKTSNQYRQNKRY